MGNDNNGGGFIVGFILGGILGAGIALLLAPSSGEETMAQLKEKSIELEGTSGGCFGRGQAQARRAGGQGPLHDGRAKGQAARSY